LEHAQKLAKDEALWTRINDRHNPSEDAFAKAGYDPKAGWQQSITGDRFGDTYGHHYYHLPAGVVEKKTPVRYSSNSSRYPSGPPTPQSSEFTSPITSREPTAQPTREQTPEPAPRQQNLPPLDWGAAGVVTEPEVLEKMYEYFPDRTWNKAMRENLVNRFNVANFNHDTYDIKKLVRGRTNDDVFKKHVNAMGWNDNTIRDVLTLVEQIHCYKSAPILRQRYNEKYKVKFFPTEQPIQ
jgi:hypothetical protein